MKKLKVSGKAVGARNDEAEQWLRANDPEYAARKRAWQAPTTDVLSRVLSGVNAVHPTLAPLKETTPKGNGGYRRQGNLPDEGSLRYAVLTDDQADE